MNRTPRPARFLRWLHGDQSGWAEIVAGQCNPEDPKKIDLVMNTRRWCFLDLEQPELYDLGRSLLVTLKSQGDTK